MLILAGLVNLLNPENVSNQILMINILFCEGIFRKPILFPEKCVHFIPMKTLHCFAFVPS